MRRRGLYFLFLLLSPSLHAVEIAFFKKYVTVIGADGKPETHLEVYEKDSPYTHVAIRVGNQWLEARPYYGVHLTDDVSGMGEISEIMVDDSIPEPGPEFLDAVLGKKYFIFADWNDPEYYHCGKLVAKYLGLAPEPIQIDPQIWGDRFDSYLGKPGLSPAQLRSALVERHYDSFIEDNCLAKLRNYR